MIQDRVRIATIFVIMSLILIFFQIRVVEGKDGTFGGGSGTEEDPYLIEDVWDLQNMTNDLGGHYRLNNDINASITKTWNSGKGFIPVGTYGNPTLYFRGHLDGNNYTISGLYINRSDEMYIGLFGYFRTPALVKNLNLVNFHVIGNKTVGGLAGYCWNGVINNCTVTGKVTGNGESIGGIVGWSINGDISDCIANVNVLGNHSVGGIVGKNEGDISICYSTGNVRSTWSSGGGVAGSNYDMISDCYSTGNISGRTAVGGLVGAHRDGGSVESCYSTGTVSGIAHTGGLIGYLETSWVTDSFWDMTTSGMTSSNGGIGKTTEQMKMEITYFPNWDFKNIWCIEDHSTYPYFTWQDTTPPVAIAGPDLIVDEDSIVEFNGDQSFDNIGIAHYIWTVEEDVQTVLLDVAPTYKFSNPGTYEVVLKVTDHSGHWDTDNFWVTVNDITPPVANAGPDQDLYDLQIQFNGSSSLDYVGIVEYKWTFIDFEPVTLFGIAPKYEFSAAGVYIVQLNVTDATGFWDTDIMRVTIIINDTTPPIANAGPDIYMRENTEIFFSGNLCIDNVEIVEYVWTFNDGTGEIILYGPLASHFFISPGVYVITLNISDSSGLWDSDQLIVTVNDTTPPVANAGADQRISENEIIYFNGEDCTDNVGIVEYLWTFNDGIGNITLYGKSPSHKFVLPGIFSINLEVIDEVGLWDVDTLVITVDDMTSPIADAGNDKTLPAGSKVILNGSLSTDNGEIVKFTWSFTYDNIKQDHKGEIIEFYFEKPGIYTIFLTVVDSAMNFDEDIIVITIIDIGVVKGLVLDDDDEPVSNASIEIVTSNGEKYSGLTGSNGRFSIEVPQGPFTWKIYKEGYNTISGDSSANAMENVEIDLSGSPLVKERQKSNSIIIIVTLLVLILLLIIGGIIFLVFKKKKDIPERQNEIKAEGGYVDTENQKNTEEEIRETMSDIDQ